MTIHQTLRNDLRLKVILTYSSAKMPGTTTTKQYGLSKSQNVTVQKMIRLAHKCIIRLLINTL